MSISIFSRDGARAAYYRLTNSPDRAVSRIGCPSGYEKKLPELYRQMTDALMNYGLHYDEFLLFDCAGKSGCYMAGFINETNRWGLYERLNDRRDLKLFHDKYRVYTRFSGYFGRRAMLLSGMSDRERLRTFAEGKKSFFVKPTGRSCGDGVREVFPADYRSPEELLTALVKDAPLICEEAITQNSVTAAFNPTSVNTVRMVTVIGSDGRVRLIHPFIRLGRFGSVVDNGAAGGIIVPVNTETGELNRVGRDENGEYYTSHPDSHVRFASTVLPFWGKARALAVSLANTVPSSRCVGWDLACTPTGWVMVEANARGQFVGQQLTEPHGVLAEFERLI